MVGGVGPTIDGNYVCPVAFRGGLLPRKQGGACLCKFFSGAMGARTPPSAEARHQTTHGQASWAGLEGGGRASSPYGM